MRTALMTAMLATSACSFGMAKVDGSWNGAGEPQCSDSYAAPIGDGLGAGLLLGVGVAAMEQEDMSGQPTTASTTIALGSLTASIVFAVASWMGTENVKDCKTARTTWRLGGAIGGARSADSNGRRDPDEYDGPKSSEWKEPPRTPAPTWNLPPNPAPRGFYCANSSTVPSAGLCARDKAECTRSADAVSASVDDVGVCALVESAWCFAEGRCAPTQAICAWQRERAGMDGMCVEVK